jgi:6-phosphogluconolactonase
MEMEKQRLLPSIEVFPGIDALNEAAADRISSIIQQRQQRQERTTIVMTGGKTPSTTYELLSQPAYSKKIDWNRLHVFWGDERCVPPEHADSNYRMAWSSLLSQVPIPAANLHRMRGELEHSEEAAELYESEILQFFSSTDIPSFDITLLGMGEDGHIASLFPGITWDESKLVVSTRNPESASKRISMTLRLLNQSALILFLVSGSRKANAVREAAIYGNKRFPASRINPINGALTWMLDASAAEEIR